MADIDNEIFIKYEQLKQYWRVKQKENYHKRKEEGTLKRYYQLKEKNILNNSNLEHIEKLKTIKNQYKPTGIKRGRKPKIII
jgi:thymidylate synthase